MPVNEKRSELIERIRRLVGPAQQFITMFVVVSSVGGYFVHNSYGDNYGAIAISIQTLEYGTTSMQPSRSKARHVALEACKKENEDAEPRDCKLAVWFYDACGALAIDRASQTKNNAWGADWAGSQKVAENKAMENCERRSRTGNCVVAESFCSI